MIPLKEYISPIRVRNNEMKQSRPALAPGVVVENVGDQTLVLVGNPPQVVRLSPEAAELLTLIQQNPSKEVEQTAPLGELVDLGVVEDASPSSLSRRGVIKLSAVAGAAGLSTILLPTAAAASSSGQTATGTWGLQGNGEIWFILDTLDFPANFDDKLTAGGTDNIGVFLGGPLWTFNPFFDPRFNDLLGQTITGTFIDSSKDEVYTVTFRPQ
jgi:hypothetical protein